MRIRRTPSMLVLAAGLTTWTSAGAWAGDALGKASWALLAAKGAAELKTGPDHVLAVTINKPSAKYYETQLTHDVVVAVPANKFLLYKFTARSATKNPIHVVIEKRTAPYTHYLDQLVPLTPDWKPYSFTVQIPKAYAAGELAVRLQVALRAGKIEFKDISVTDSAH